MTDFDYPAFLAARLDEQDVRIQEYLIGDEVINSFGVEYQRADIAAKRAILERFESLKDAYSQLPNETEEQRVIRDQIMWQLRGRYDDIQDLCRPFADHPDYQGDRS